MLGLAAGALSLVTPEGAGGARDLAQSWYASRAILHGQNPYALIGPGRPMPFLHVFVYPLTAAVAVLPLAGHPIQWACTIFVFIGTTAFAWALTEHRYAPLISFLGVGMVFAVREAQWAPMLAAATVIPPLGFLFAAKPTIGAAMFAARPNWWPFFGGVFLLAVAFALQPHWFEHWRGALSLQPPAPGAPERYRILVRDVPGAVLVLAALSRWRRPEARMLIALACIPQTTVLYETTPLALIPRTWKESLLLVLLGYGVLAWILWHLPVPGSERLALGAHGMVWLLYLPCTLMVLRRPNEGPAPAWLEQRITHWPAWLRGTAHVASPHAVQDS